MRMDLPSSNEHKFVKGVDSCSTCSPSKIVIHNRDGAVLEVSKSAIEGELFDDILYKEVSSSMDLFHHLHLILLQEFYHDVIQPIVEKNAKDSEEDDAWVEISKENEDADSISEILSCKSVMSSPNYTISDVLSSLMKRINGYNKRYEVPYDEVYGFMGSNFDFPFCCICDKMKIWGKRIKYDEGAAMYISNIDEIGADLYPEVDADADADANPYADPDPDLIVAKLPAQRLHPLVSNVAFEELIQTRSGSGWIWKQLDLEAAGSESDWKQLASIAFDMSSFLSLKLLQFFSSTCISAIYIAEPLEGLVGAFGPQSSQRIKVQSVVKKEELNSKGIHDFNILRYENGYHFPSLLSSPMFLPCFYHLAQGVHAWMIEKDYFIIPSQAIDIKNQFTNYDVKGLNWVAHARKIVTSHLGSREKDYSSIQSSRSKPWGRICYMIINRQDTRISLLPFPVRVGSILRSRLAQSTLSEVSVDWRSHLLVEYSKNRHTCEILDGHIQDDNYRLEDEMIFYQGRLYLVSNSWLRMEILRHVHCISSVTGHLSFDETYRFIWERFRWHGLREDILNFIQGCIVCCYEKSELTGSSFSEPTWDSTPMYFIASMPGEHFTHVLVSRGTKLTQLLGYLVGSHSTQEVDTWDVIGFRVDFCTRGLTGEAGDTYVTGLRLSKATEKQIIKADAYVAACDVPGIKRLIPPEWRKWEFFDNIYKLVGVPVVTVQLRFNGWVTELQDIERSRQLNQAAGLDNLLYTPDADFSCFADLAIASPEDYYRPGQGSLLQAVLTPGDPYMPLPNEEIIDRVHKQVLALFPSAQGLEVTWSNVVKIGQSLYREAPGVDPFRPNQKTPLKNFFIAGSYTKQDYIDSMEGATLSGRQASAYICDAGAMLAELRSMLQLYDVQGQVKAAEGADKLTFV
ncbi:hypothetical protein KI387_014008 [Taxus chinensis]|uniref:Amine oxidase domain-containing protein n=1 Tax=Taxus chinensis TaxID=29808 RepID=A0AA38FHK0_TAXCH|nr:hypothetical protein KI387_014008 [Taxus chinensis]